MFTRLATDSRGRPRALLVVLLGLAASLLALSVHLLVGGLSGGSAGDPASEGFGWFAYTPGDVVGEDGGPPQLHYDDYEAGNTSDSLFAVAGSGAAGYGTGIPGLAVWAFGTALVVGWLYLRARANRSFDLRFIALVLLLWTVCWPSDLFGPSWGQPGLFPAWLVALVGVPLALSVARRDAVAAVTATAAAPPGAPAQGGPGTTPSTPAETAGTAETTGETTTTDTDTDTDKGKDAGKNADDGGSAGGSRDTGGDGSGDGGKEGGGKEGGGDGPLR